MNLTDEQKKECHQYALNFGSVGDDGYKQAVFSFICGLKKSLDFDTAD